MKILLIHADFIEFEAKKKAFKGAEEGIKEGKQRVEECLVVLTAVEKRDETNIQKVIARYVQEIKNVAQQVNAKNIVLYPYAHLSSSLANPKMAEQVLKDAENILNEKYIVSRAPFGWYKAFNLSCKGHPLSELSREFSAESSDAKKVDLKKEFKDEQFEFSDRELDNNEKISLTTALVLGKAVKDLFNEAQVGELGFYHNHAYIDLANVKLSNDDLDRISKQMQKILNANLEIETGSKSDIKDEWQLKILNVIGQDKPIYKFEDVAVVPLFKNSFVNSTKEIKAFKIINLASAYWRGNQNNQQLSRIYVAGFVSNEKLQKFLKEMEEAENRSHLVIGKKQNLFVVSDQVGAGLPLLTPKGTIIREEIIHFLWSLHHGKGYQKVWTPHIAKDLLYKTSGHWDKFGDDLFHVKGKTENFVMKPMNCPHHMKIFDSFSLSYRDMPVRFFEPATVYRDEKSGQLHGLSRVRAITQDDGHLFCRFPQIKKEVESIISIILEFYKTFGMNDYWVSLSVRGEDKSKYLGKDEEWEVAEKALHEAAEKNQLPFRKVEGEASFYGPKLDFTFKDSLGREQQLATIQLDFNLPERFDLGFMNEESLREKPVVIHRAISGSSERFMSVMIEHFSGAFPLWLNPEQVRVVTITDRSKEFAEQIVKKMVDANIRVELDDRTETMGRKVRDAQMAKVNYIVTIGDKEVDSSTLAVRDRKGENKFGVNIDEFISEIVRKIHSKELD